MTKEIQRGCVSVVIPVYNEAATVRELLDKVTAQACVGEMIVVDDGSSDRTWDVLQGLSGEFPLMRLYRHEKNQGKGAALRTGFSKAAQAYVLIQDADLEYDPEQYPLLIEPIVYHEADVVFGSRFQGAGAHRVLYFWHYMGNRFLTLLSNMFTDLNLTDMETCYKAFRPEIIQSITIEEDRFGFEPEITAKVAAIRPRIKIYEVPISYYGRTYEEGKKIGWRDGFRALWSIVKYNLLK